MQISIRRTIASVLACVGALACSSAQAQSSAEVYFSSELRPQDDIWYTAPPPESAITYRLSRQPNIAFTAPQPGVNPIDVNPNLTFQEMIGFGTSLEDTTLYAILKNKTDAQRRALLRELFDPVNGIGLKIIRVTIGTSDFSDGRTVSAHPRGFYSYQDGGENSAFSIANDRNIYNATLGYPGGIIAAVKLALEVARQAGNEPFVFASAWSPPAWMKTSNALIGGSLRPGFEARLAQYFRNFIQAYAAEGIPIHALTIQNERNFVPTNYPGMLLSDQQEADVVRATYENFNNIGGSFGPIIDARLWILDHNFSLVQSAINVVNILKAQGKGHYVDAAAFHHYGGNPADMSRFTSAHPETDLVFTEGSVWGTGPTPTTSFESVLRMLRTGARTYVGWVTMSTRNKAEHNQGPFTNTNLSPTLFIETGGAAYVKTPEYWLFGQFSKFIKPGAVRIDSEYGSTANVTTVAFRNPNGQTVLVAVNGTTSAKPFSIGYRGVQAASTLPAKTIGTYLWSDGGNPAPTVTIATPTNGQSFAAGAAVQVTGTATDNSGVASIEYVVDGGAPTVVAANGQTSVPFSRSLTGLPAGAHTVRVVAIDNGNPALRSAAITIGFTLGGGGGFTGDGTYRIVNLNSGRALDVAGVSLADGANIQQWTYGGGNNQRWRVTTVTAGVYRIDAVHSGKTLDVRGVSTANGAQIQQWAFAGGNNQLWRIVSLGSNQFRIESVHSAKSLTVSGASTANGALIQQSDYTGANNQRWTFAAP